MPPALIFSLLFFATSVITVTAGVVGVTSGEIERTVVKPIQHQITSLQQTLIATPRPTFVPPSFSPKPKTSPTPSPKPSAKPVNKKPTTSSKVIIVTPKPVSTSTSTFDQQAWDAKVKQMQQDADARYQQALKDQQTWSQQQSAANQQWLEEQTAKAKAEQEQWKKDHGF